MTEPADTSIDVTPEALDDTQSDALDDTPEAESAEPTGDPSANGPAQEPAGTAGVGGRTAGLGGH